MTSRARSLPVVIVLALLVGACGSERAAIGVDAGSPAPDAGPMGLPVLGNGTHSIDSVELVEIAGPADALSTPRDLAFDPERPGMLWVVNNTSHSVTILSDVGTPAQDWRRRAGVGSDHFLSKPSAIAFGAPGTLSTAQDETEITQPDTEANFMGPTLWTSNLTDFDGGHHGHIDMMHNSPGAVGIAWERDNVYWIFDGEHQSLTQYDFRRDHGLGGEDHSDGVVRRYAQGEVTRVPDVAGHLAFDTTSGLLYVADTGNNRIAVLDPSGATMGARIVPNYDGSDQAAMVGGTIMTLVDGAAAGLTRPSGLHLLEGRLYVTDHATSRVHAFSLDGTPIDWVDLSSIIPPDSLMGIDADAEGRLYLADAAGSRIFRLAAR